MAEVLLNALAGDRYEAESAGLEPKEIHPLVMEVMKEEGFDLSGKQAKSVFEFFKEGRLYDYVITVCDDATEAKCPVFPGVRQRLHWPFPDPEGLKGGREQRLEEVRKIRDEIRARIVQMIEEGRDA
jgi:arsenate reductase